jgi:tetratricopeptide (TPR) repeat protein
MRRGSVLLFAVALHGTPASAQFPPERATNLQVLPSGIPMDSLVSLMSGFTRALGVRCAYCHVQREGQTFEQIDFALDENAKKNVARTMLRLVAAINNEHLSDLTERREPQITVTCATCHRGVVEPRSLQEVVLNTYVASGPDSAEATYGALRDRYFGSGSYDFGEVPLADVAAFMEARGEPADAMRFHTLNVRLNPRSTFALRQLAGAHLAAHDTASAISAYERALAINPADRQSEQARDALRRRN